MAGAPLGNTNRANGKRFANALKAALDEYEDDRVKRGEALRVIAKDLIRDALAGDADARKELVDRVDGKPTTVIAGDDDLPPVQLGVIELVRPE